MGRQEIEDGIARMRIAAGGNKTSRLMQHDVEAALTVNEFAVNFDVVALVRLDAEIGADPPVNRNPTGGDELIAMAPRTEAGRGEIAVKAHREKCEW
jgi:hypothetical protein